MARKLLVPGIATAMLLFAIYHVVRAQHTVPDAPPPVEPARTPYGKTLAAAGIVEAETENIAIGAHLPGVVDKVDARVGQKVQPGDVLFRLDARHLQAELKLRQANLAADQAQLVKLESMPRAEELPPAKAKVRETQATLDNWADQHERAKILWQTRAIGEEDVIKLRQFRRAAQELYDKAQAELQLLQAGAWEPDKDVARTNVAMSEARVAMAQTELDRLEIKAPIAGEVLQVNVRPGEYVGTPPGQPLVVLGNINQLHVRVDVDEYDIHRYQPGSTATARLRGDPKQKFNLRFVRVEPFVVPKKALAGVNTERVDTRVLQVIYAVEAPAPRIYVGQQLDVFLEAQADRGQ